MNSHHKRIAQKFGANIAGVFYGIGNFLQLGLGILSLSPIEIMSALLNISASFLMIFKGHKNWGVSIAYVLGTIAVTLAIWPSLINYELGTVFGYVIFLITQVFCIFSAYLTRIFQHSNTGLFLVFGRPRRTAGLVSLCLSRMPIIYENIMHHRLKLVAVFALWALGDLAVSVSRPEIKKS